MKNCCGCCCDKTKCICGDDCKCECTSCECATVKQ